jgi:hypothetical protein
VSGRACWLALAALALAAAGGVEVTQHVILLEPSEKELAVTESFLFNNPGGAAFRDPSGAAVRVWIPDAAEETIQVTVIGPDNRATPAAAVRAGRPNTYQVDVPIEPGESRIDVVYRLPVASPAKFATRLLQNAAQARLVAPAGVEVEGPGLELIGREPRSQAQVFGVSGKAIEVEIAGTGSIRAAEAAEDEESGPGIQQILPRLYDRVYLVVGLALAILALGFVMLYRRKP